MLLIKYIYNYSAIFFKISTVNNKIENSIHFHQLLIYLCKTLNQRFCYQKHLMIGRKIEFHL